MACEGVVRLHPVDVFASCSPCTVSSQCCSLALDSSMLRVNCQDKAAQALSASTSHQGRFTYSQERLHESIYLACFTLLCGLVA